MGGHILLVGMMGSGKSTVAPLLAARLGRPWIDTDQEVAITTSSSVSDCITSRGEPYFRDQETRALETALSREAPAVVSVGGGAVLRRSNRDLIRRGGLVVWLRATPGTLARRVGDGAGRPLLRGDLLASLTRLSRERADLYLEVADAVVDTDDLRPDEVVDLLLAVDADPSRRREPTVSEGTPRP